MNQTVFTHNGFPKVGIRPIIDGHIGASDDPTGADYRACKNFGPLYATNR